MARSGEASIKPQYQLERAHRRDRNQEREADHVTNTSQSQDGIQVTCDRDQGKEQKDKTDTRDQENNRNISRNAEAGRPESNKKRRKGQNKKRKRPYIVPRSDMLCQFVNRGDPCHMGDRCKKSHDKSLFLERKGDDLGRSCGIFEKFGFCSYGLACRFGTSHIDSNLDNIIDRVKYDKMKIYEVQRTLERDLQMKLRSRRVHFNRSYAVFDRLNVDYAADLKANEDMRINREKRRKVGSQTKKNEVKCDEKDNDKMESKDDCENEKDIDNHIIESKDHGDDCENKTAVCENKTADCENKTADCENKTADCENKTADCENKTPDCENKTPDCENKTPDCENKTADCEITATEVTDEYYTLHHRTKKSIEFKGKSYLAPLTTLGNLPFRRICKEYGADITCGEMALCEDLLQGNLAEWALLKRHHTEDIFGVQICGSHVIKTTKTCELINSECDADFIDLNVGCPIDMVFNRGAGSALMDRPNKLADMLRGMVAVSDIPVSVKMRIGTTEDKLSAVNLCRRFQDTGVSLITVHGRTRQQRYTRLADWNYVSKCREACSPVTLFGNGDILSYQDYNTALLKTEGVMIGRGALIKPWIFKEIKDQEHWDISSSQRMELLHKFTKYGLEHWGCDTVGVEKTRHFLLEWLSFLYRYIPVGVLEVLPQKINERPPYYHGRDDTETLMCSANCNDWVKLSELLLGKVPDGFKFLPKHAANSYS